MRWNQNELDEALDEALRDGIAIREPKPTGKHRSGSSDARAMRYALYNRAKTRGIHPLLRFELNKSMVYIRKNEITRIQAPAPEAPPSEDSAS